MDMKNRIRRAFDAGKPNVLSQVLEDCPAKENAAVLKPKKKMSDRTKEFIATAASLALLLCAVGVGAVYFGDLYGDVTVKPGTTSTSDDEIIEGVRQLVCPDAVPEDMPATVVRYEAEEEGKAVPYCRVTVSYNGYSYEFIFRGESRMLWDIDIPATDSVKEGYLSPAVVQQIVILDAVGTAFDQVVSSKTFEIEDAILTKDENAYTVAISYYQNHVYHIDSQTGQILYIKTGTQEPDRTDAVSDEDIIAYAMELVAPDAPREDFRIFLEWYSETEADKTVFYCRVSACYQEHEYILTFNRYGMLYSLDIPAPAADTAVPITPAVAQLVVRLDQVGNDLLYGILSTLPALFDAVLSEDGSCYTVEIIYFDHYIYTLDSQTGAILSVTTYGDSLSTSSSIP